jgi:formylglycine-generating enzyme required for sulfatase activity
MWLGIPPKEQPADFYRLLGISRFETDVEAIVNAADRQMRHIRTFQLGKNARDSQKLLNELATARACLRDSTSKAAYDERLSAQIAQQNPPPIATRHSASSLKTRRSRRSQPQRPIIEVVKVIAGGICGVAIATVLLWYGFGMDVLGVVEPREERTTDPLALDFASPKPNIPRPDGRGLDEVIEVKQKEPGVRPDQPSASTITPHIESAPSAPVQVPSTERDERAAVEFPPQLRSGGTVPSLAVAPFNAAQARGYQQAWADFLGLPMRFRNSLGMSFELIPPGVFTMGSPSSEQTYATDEVQREVEIANPFYLAETEVTQTQFEIVMKSNPSEFRGPDRPVEMVTWEAAASFCEKLTEIALPDIVSGSYRLPKEEEWEFACRAGTTTRFSFGDEDTDLSSYGWYGDNSGVETLDTMALWLEVSADGKRYSERLTANGCKTHPVGTLRPNPFGLYDMHGNVYEWCQDACEPNTTTRDLTYDTGMSEFHVRRSSTCFDSSWSSRSARRYCNCNSQPGSTQGMRVLLQLPPDLLARIETSPNSITVTSE